MERRINITKEQLAERLDGVHWHGDYFSCKCPYARSSVRHKNRSDTRPSFMVNDQRGHCLTCEKTVSLEVLWAKVGNRKAHHVEVNQSGAFNWKGVDLLEFSISAHETVLKCPELRYYFIRRGVDSLVERNQLGWIQGWYTVPAFDDDDKLVGLVLRAGPSIEADMESRYIVPPGVENNLFIPDWGMIHRARRIKIVFGIFDALGLAANRIPVMTPLLGKHLDPVLLEPFRVPLDFVPDYGEDDEARKIVSNLDWRGNLILIDYPTGTKDPSGMIERGFTKQLLARLG